MFQYVDEKIVEKPKDEEDAFEMIKRYLRWVRKNNFGCISVKSGLFPILSRTFLILGDTLYNILIKKRQN